VRISFSFPATMTCSTLNCFVSVVITGAVTITGYNPSTDLHHKYIVARA
jgi:hypothetical protein